MAKTYYQERDNEQFAIFDGARLIDRAVTIDHLVRRYPEAINIKPTYGEIARDYALWDTYCRRSLPLTREQFDEGDPADRLTNMTFQGGVDEDVFRDNPRKVGFSREQAEWINFVQSATNMDLHHAIELHDQLADLTAKHFALHLMANGHGEPFTKAHGLAWDQIEKEMSEAVSGLKGITGMVFRRHDVAATSGVKFESGLTNVPSVGGIYTMRLNDDVVPKLLKQPFWVEYETRARNDAITETIKTLQATRDEWARTAARSDNKLIGERNIIIDNLGRAFGQYAESGQSMIKLELPSASLKGVSHMDAENAEKAKAILESAVPDAGPFRIWDFETYARSEVATNEQLIVALQQRLSTAVVPVENVAVLRDEDEPGGP